MQTFHETLPTEPRLRVVFDDATFSFGFSPMTTFADLADWVDDVARIHHGAPVAIDVTLATTQRQLDLANGFSQGTR